MLAMILTTYKNGLVQMMWLDYTVEQFGPNFTVRGDWPGEVMGIDKDGKPGHRDQPLYQPGDIFVVNSNGILMKIPAQTGDVLMVNTQGELVPFARHSEDTT